MQQGGYTQMRHDEIRDTFAAIMKDVCFDVEIEPKLQPLDGDSFVHTTTTTEDDTRLDFKANGLWIYVSAELSSMSKFLTH